MYKVLYTRKKVTVYDILTKQATKFNNKHIGTIV